MPQQAQVSAPGQEGDAHPAGEGLLAAVFQHLQFLGGGVGDDHGMVLPDVAVGLGLQLAELILVQQNIQVDGDKIGAHVEAHIVTAPLGVGQAGDDMFAGVVLHQVKAPLPVDLALDGGADVQRSAAGVHHTALPLVDLQHVDAAQYAQVIGLAAPLRVESGLIQQDVKAFFALDAGLHGGGEFGQIGVLFIQFFHETPRTYFLCCSKAYHIFVEKERVGGSAGLFIGAVVQYPQRRRGGAKWQS